MRHNLKGALKSTLENKILQLAIAYSYFNTKHAIN